MKLSHAKAILQELKYVEARRVIAEAEEEALKVVAEAEEEAKEPIIEEPEDNE